MSHKIIYSYERVKFSCQNSYLVMNILKKIDILISTQEDEYYVYTRIN